MTLLGRIPVVGRSAPVGRWRGYDSTFDPASLANLWAIDPANSTLGGTLAATGTTPPVVTISGTLSTPKGVRVEITTGGVLGVAVFRVSINNGSTYVASNVTTVATYTIPGTALVLNFPAGTYTNDNVYRATAASVLDTSPAVQLAAQATPANQPFFTLANASFNGNPTIDGPNATATALDTGLFSAFAGTTTIVIVCKSTSASTSGNQAFFNRTGGGTNFRILTFLTSGGQNNRIQTLSTVNNFYQSNLLGPSILIAEYNASSGTVSLWLNGNYLGTGSDTVAAINSFRIFNNAGSTAPFQGSIADVRIAGKTFSRTERRAMFGYFANKHAIPIAVAA